VRKRGCGWSPQGRSGAGGGGHAFGPCPISGQAEGGLAAREGNEWVNNY